MNDALKVEHVNKTYPGFSLTDVCFELPKGSIMGLVGENGAGKSTIIKILLGLVQKDSGKVQILGERDLEKNKYVKEDIGVVFDEINFYETLTPVKVEKICKNAYKNWDSTAYASYLEQFSLPKDKEIKTFSKGMQVKLCLAVAMSHQAKLLLLDEPTSGLDPIVREELLDIFLEFVQDEEHAVLLSSHITTDLEKIADYITFLHKGNVIFSTSKDELIYHYGLVKCKEALFRQMDRGDILAYRKLDYSYEVLVADREMAGRKYPEAVIDPATIEEIMLLYVKGEKP